VKLIKCFLKKGKEKPLENKHPWVFSGAIDRIEDDFETGDLVTVLSADGKYLGTGYLNPRSQIAIRILCFDEVKINESFFASRIEDALALRSKYLPPNTTAYRAINSEGDFLSGLIVDRYGEYLVVQFLTAGIEKWKDTIIKILVERLPVKGIYEKNDIAVRELEGLDRRAGKLYGEEPPDLVKIQENGLNFAINIHQGQKTGFFLDQRDNRQLIGEISDRKRILNCFAYTGGFSVYAAKGGASETVSVETSESALNTAKHNFEINNLTGDNYQFVKEDVFNYLRSTRQEFDMIILDPPAFCQNKHQIQKASRAYKDINLYAMKLLQPGGLLFTCSCSSHINSELFQKIIFAAAKDARKNVRIIHKSSHAVDHPINIYHPEGEYLKGLLCLVT